MNVAEIIDGVVVNVIVVDPDAIPDWAEGWPVVTDAGPGWLYADGVFIPPPEPPVPVPDSLSNLQFAMAAVADGLMTGAEAEAWVGRGDLPALVLDAIATLPEEEQAFARIRFAGARTIARTDPLVELIRVAADLTDARVDDLFRNGAAL